MSDRHFRRVFCGGCGGSVADYLVWPGPSTRVCPGCGWRMYVPCPDCGAEYPNVKGKDPFEFHRKACRARDVSQTLRNLTRMRWNRLKGRGCARYIEEQERDHLRKLLKR